MPVNILCSSQLLGASLALLATSALALALCLFIHDLVESKLGFLRGNGEIGPLVVLEDHSVRVRASLGIPLLNIGVIRGPVGGSLVVFVSCFIASAHLDCPVGKLSSLTVAWLSSAAPRSHHGGKAGDREK